MIAGYLFILENPVILSLSLLLVVNRLERSRRIFCNTPSRHHHRFNLRRSQLVRLTPRLHRQFSILRTPHNAQRTPQAEAEIYQENSRAQYRIADYEYIRKPDLLQQNAAADDEPQTENTDPKQSVEILVQPLFRRRLVETLLFDRRQLSAATIAVFCLRIDTGTAGLAIHSGYLRALLRESRRGGLIIHTRAPRGR